MMKHIFVQIFLFLLSNLSIANSAGKQVEVCGELHAPEKDVLCIGSPCTPISKYMLELDDGNTIVIRNLKDAEIEKQFVKYAKTKQIVCLSGSGSAYAFEVKKVELKFGESAPSSQPATSTVQKTKSAQ